MTIAAKIEKAIAKMPEGAPFKFRDLGILPDDYAAATKALERLAAKGVIARASTGLYYKPLQTVFGALKPREEELLRPYLFENNKRVAYITGTALYNRMGLTTQVPKNIRVASRSKRVETKVGSVQVKPIKSYIDITDRNYYLAELLDVLKDFKTIPDLDVVQAITFMLQKLKDLSPAERDQLIKIAMQYPPRVRAFAGALLEKLNPKNPVTALKKTINPLTTFDLGITKKQLPTIENWNIRSL